MKLRFAAALLTPLVGCAPSPEVSRVMAGEVVAGRFIPPEAYAAFLRGVVAEEAGDAAGALAAYRLAAAEDGSAPEIWTHIGALLCAGSGSGAPAVAAFDRALAADPTYGPALAERARCEGSRGDPRAAELDALQAASADPRASPSTPGTAGLSRRGLVALALLHETLPATWDALASLGAAQGDAPLVARALAEVARLAPSRRSEVSSRAIQLAGDGEVVAARSLAGAIVDLPEDRAPTGIRAPAAGDLLARLAVDEAIFRDDVDAARRRSVRAHLGADVVAGRALMAGHTSLARALAEPLVRADPSAMGPRMALAAAAYRLGDRDALSTAFAALPAGGRPPDGRAIAVEALLAFAAIVEGASSTDTAKRLLGACGPIELLAGDALVLPVAVELAARGSLSDAVLPIDARIELAARRSESLPEVGASDQNLDARHRLFAGAIASPRDPVILELARRLAPGASHDPLIAVALARIAIANGGEPTPKWLEPVLALDPGDPILAAAALDVARRTGDALAIAPARARLTALARTPGERARARE